MRGAGAARPSRLTPLVQRAQVRAMPPVGDPDLRTFTAHCSVFKLPVAANLAKISAVCDHGVLSISVPKAAETHPALREHVPIASGEDSPKNRPPAFLTLGA